MPVFNITQDLTDPSGSLTATKYFVQNQGYCPVRLAVSTSAISAKTADAIILATMNGRGGSQLEYTHATGKHVRIWAEGGDGIVVFHEL